MTDEHLTGVTDENLADLWNDLADELPAGSSWAGASSTAPELYRRMDAIRTEARQRRNGGELRMASWIITTARHQGTWVSRRRSLIDASTTEEALLVGFTAAICELFDGHLDMEDMDAIEVAVTSIIGPGGPTIRYAKLELQDGARSPLLLWYSSPDTGVGPGYVGRSGPRLTGDDNRWLAVERWDGNPERRAQLAGLDREQLIDIVVRLEAVTQE